LKDKTPRRNGHAPEKGGMYNTRKNTDDSFGDEAVEMTDIDERVAPVTFANNIQ